MSNTWRGITENVHFICEGMRSTVDNGLNTLLSKHKWAMNTTLQSVATQTIPEELLDKKVANIWEVDMGWKWESFSDYLPSDALKQIQTCELKNDPELAGLIYWLKGSKGKFSIKSVLSIMRHEEDFIDDNTWDKIWGAHIQQRARVFLWLVYHDRVLGNYNKYRRHMVDNSKCYLCGAHEETTTIHIIRDCPATKMIWKKIGVLPSQTLSSKPLSKNGLPEI